MLSALGDPITANIADPGVVDTALFAHAGWVTRAVQRILGWLLFKVGGAQTLQTLCDSCVVLVTSV